MTNILRFPSPAARLLRRLQRAMQASAGQRSLALTLAGRKECADCHATGCALNDFGGPKMQRRGILPPLATQGGHVKPIVEFMRLDAERKKIIAKIRVVQKRVLLDAGWTMVPTTRNCVGRMLTNQWKAPASWKDAFTYAVSLGYAWQYHLRRTSKTARLFNVDQKEPQ